MIDRWIYRSHDDWRWTLRAGLSNDTIAAMTEPSWSRLLGSPGVGVIKASRRRSVIRLPESADSPTIYCKQFVRDGLADWLRTTLRGSPAHWEASRIQLAEERGLPTAELLGLGEHRDGLGVRESRLLTRAIEDVVTLGSWCTATELPEVNLADSPPDRAAWLAALADLIAGLHGRGLWHGDLHAGNVLLRRDDGLWRCWLIDLSALRGGRRTPVPYIHENLARFWLSMERLSTSAERVEFARRYWDSLRLLDQSLAGQLGSDAGSAARHLVDAAVRVVAPIHRKADQVWQRGNRKVQVTPHGRYLASLGEDWWREFSEGIEAWWGSGVDALASSGTEVRRIHRATPFGMRSFRLIRFPKAVEQPGMSRARTAWEAGHALHRRACPVAVPWGYVAHEEEEYLAACEPEGSRPLSDETHASATIVSLVQQLDSAGFVIDETAADAIRGSRNGEWWGWCALEGIRPRRRGVPSPRSAAVVERLQANYSP